MLLFMVYIPWSIFQMNSVQLHIAKESNDRLQLWMDASDVLKRDVIKSLGAAVREIITVKTAHFQQMMVAEIIAKVAKGHQNSGPSS
jgi:hypothetical protein